MSTGQARLALAIACVLATGPTLAQHKATRVSEPTEALAEQLAGQYAGQQMARLAKLEDRDSLIAAALIGTPNVTEPEPEGHDEVLQQLATNFPTDPLALYAAALVCHLQARACKTPEFQERLVEIEPDNAVNYLLAPNGRQPSLEQLGKAADTARADSHFSALLGIVRSALTEQPAPAAEGRKVNETQLALQLRRTEVGYVPWPRIGPTMGLCNADVASRSDQATLQATCAKLGALLFKDQGNNLVTRMFGVTLLRRFAKGTPAAAEALELRRQYVWLSELPDETAPAEMERLQDEEVALGEWEAFQRHAERKGVSRTPPVGWAPLNPEFILLPEERTPKTDRSAIQQP